MCSKNCSLQCIQWGTTIVNKTVYCILYVLDLHSTASKASEAYTGFGAIALAYFVICTI